MKTTITPTTEEQPFEPFEYHIFVESKDEAMFLWHLFNMTTINVQKQIESSKKVTNSRLKDFDVSYPFIDGIIMTLFDKIDDLMTSRVLK